MSLMNLPSLKVNFNINISSKQINLDYHTGSIPLAHDSQHVFKDVDKRSQLKKNDFFTYGYLTDVQKVK
jgi:hypothetical protein